MMTDLQSALSAFQLAIERRRTVEETLRHHQTDIDRQERVQRQQLNEAQQELNQELATLQAEISRQYEAITARYDEELESLDQEHRQNLKRVVDWANRELQTISQQKHDSTWVVSSVLDDTAEDSPAREFERFRTLILKSREVQTNEWNSLRDLITPILEKFGFTEPVETEFERVQPDREAIATRFRTASNLVRSSHQKFKSLILPRLFVGLRPFVLFLLLTALVAGAIHTFVDPTWIGIAPDQLQSTWTIMTVSGGAIVSLLIVLILLMLGSSRRSELLRQMQVGLAETEWLHQHWMKLTADQLARQEREFEAKQRVVERDRERTLKRFEAAYRDQLSQIESQRDTQISALEKRHRERRDEIERRRLAEQTELQNRYVQRDQEIRGRWSNQLQRLESSLEVTVSQQRRVHQDHWTEMVRDWRLAAGQLSQEIQEVTQFDAQVSRPWNQLVQSNWNPPSGIPPVLRMGVTELDLKQWPEALSEQAELKIEQTQYDVPALIPFPQGASVMLTSHNSQSRQQAIAGLQTLMLRLLTSLPPGKLRFTIIDPVGLGESFGGFMHLADYDEMLVTNRIWTEANQIEARLADLTEHMENVLQKYLRNEFPTIEEYNESAGEVAEPYHFLVISDFPSKFSEIAARRLVSIVNSGPRCGVYTLLHRDADKELPHQFRLSDIEEKMTRFEWRDNAYRAVDSQWSPWPLKIDSPPPSDVFTSLVKMVGNASKDARKVEVSFDRVRPATDRLWTDDSRSEITIPLGRAGATKLQMLRLGKGTSQHMLVAGKTGSGKSTFLHILITNLALRYSPDEVNFFLIDFKKGVEFKDYATHHLPHAQVIAVESDREFGVSALQRLSDILQERGELFRRHGVQDIAGYRNATDKPLPRILLVIDEFQEFFVEDDKIGQAAALHLDRLVRQGRAFGIHVILGSQTLGGAYSLARSTLGQVAVRVALQCSEADAHLILSEDNSAARLLTRPGEAIYNDANGMPEGNHPFQIAWITDQQREAALNQMQHELRRRLRGVPATVVFEGNIPSDLRRNPNVDELARDFQSRSQPILYPTIWLGDAVEIAPPTALTFHRQNGNHLLLVGQDTEAAQGLMTSAAVTLAASMSAAQEDQSLFVLDGSHPGSDEAQVWEELCQEYESEIRLVRPNETAGLLQAITLLLEQRENEPQPDAPPVFLLVFNLARFRDLRKVEDDFGMGSFGLGGSEAKPVEPGKLFSDILLRGPSVGIHTVIWCDSSNNVERWFSRQTLKEMEQRVAFQMNAADSSNFIDSPAASRLGTHRALIYREETGAVEKFRPYGTPPIDWLRSLHQQMQSSPENGENGADDIPDLEQFTIL